MESTHLSTDVTIIGGGLAGLNAVLGEAERGAKVLVADHVYEPLKLYPRLIACKLKSLREPQGP